MGPDHVHRRSPSYDPTLRCKAFHTAATNSQIRLPPTPMNPPIHIKMNNMLNRESGMPSQETQLQTPGTQTAVPMTIMTIEIPNTINGRFINP
jgi:hypothetical protein